MTTPRTLVATLVGVATVVVAASAFAQAQFRDDKTGKTWTPENVGKESRLRPANEPTTAADRAFDRMPRSPRPTASSCSGLRRR